jgi:hypothetical protein
MMLPSHSFAALLIGVTAPALAQDEGWTDPVGAPAPAPVSQAPVFDDLDRFVPAWRARQILAELQGLASPDHVGPESTRTPLRSTVAPQSKSGQGIAPTSRFDLRGLMTDVLVAENGADGRVWVRGHAYKASFGPDGFTFLPAFGADAPQNYPVELDLGSIAVGGRQLELSAVPRVSRDGKIVTLDHGSLREVFLLDLEQVEQTFVIDGFPGAGDLVIRIDVATELAPMFADGVLRFMHEAFGWVAYGDAFVLDSSGVRLPIERTWTGSAIELTVPASFLAEATYPVTVDPPVTAFTNTSGGGGAPQDSFPDITWSGGTDRFWITWQHHWSATDKDCYAASFTTAGTFDDLVTIDFTTDAWRTPRIAYHVNSQRCLVVAAEEAVSTGFGSIQGQFVDTAAGTATGTQFLISSSGAAKVHPDVGGNNWNSATSSHFCVVWSTLWTPGTWHQLQYRIVDWDGTLVTTITSPDATNNIIDNEPAISETHGDGDLFGDYWTIAWIRDADNNGFGQVWARRVVWSGLTTLGAGSFLVDSATNNAAPTVTSRFDRELLFVADRPSIVAYEKDFPSATPPPARQRSIYAKVITDGAAYVENSVSYILEDFDLELDQREPSIACDGNCFYLTYSEVYYGSPAGTDYDQYMLSGCISDLTDNAALALAERHQNMAFSATPEHLSSVCTVWDGEEASISDDGCAIWEDRDQAIDGSLELYTLEIPTLNASTTRAVGRQFCDANPNSGGGQIGRQVSWSWLLGNQSLGSTHSYYCLDMPLNTFGYAIASRNVANINLAGGGLGRLCMTGSGRYVDQVASSGTSGMLTTTINPMNLPQPTGFVSAAAGETWHFQYWHRDVGPGGATFNFSVACRMQFTN